MYKYKYTLLTHSHSVCVYVSEVRESVRAACRNGDGGDDDDDAAIRVEHADGREGEAAGRVVCICSPRMAERRAAMRGSGSSGGSCKERA